MSNGAEEEWVAKLTAKNFLAVYDVVLDIRSELQLSNTPTIAALPSVVRFSQLMPADTINLRDDYMETRWKAVQLLKTKGIVADVSVDRPSHRWETRLTLRVDHQRCNLLAAAMDAEYAKRTSEPAEEKRGDSVEAGGEEGSPLPSPELLIPERVTLSWLVQHVPVGVWLSLLAAAFAIFVAGAKVGQTSLVRELLGAPPSVSLTPEEVKQRIDRLVEGHNANVAQITSAIVEEEKRSATATYSDERGYHAQAAIRLREALKSEREGFLKALNELKSLERK